MSSSSGLVPCIDFSFAYLKACRLTLRLIFHPHVAGCTSSPRCHMAATRDDWRLPFLAEWPAADPAATPPKGPLRKASNSIERAAYRAGKSQSWLSPTDRSATTPYRFPTCKGSRIDFGVVFAILWTYE